MENKKLRVFYNENQVVENNQSFSPSAGKPKLLIEELQKPENTELFSQIELYSDFEPLKREDFYLAHDKTHVDDILELRKNNGFSNKLESVAKSLYWTNASFVRAAQYSLTSKQNSMSPTSGFHHAETDVAKGFCTFNGLMIAVEKLRQLKPNVKIGIVDFDAHYGDGTDEIIARKNLEDSVIHYTFGEFAEKLKTTKKFDSWLDNLTKNLHSYNFSKCDILFYQAGADPFVNDPYGGFLTKEQMIVRDRKVFRFGKEVGVPIVWNLAGGYTKPISEVLEIHLNTFREYFDR